MPEQHSTPQDHLDPCDVGPASGVDAVVFSSAPAPDLQDDAPAAPEPSGWPWFLPQDGLRPEDLERAADLDEGPAAAEALARIPLVRGATILREHVGEGLPLSTEGELPAADVRALAEALDLDVDDEQPASMRRLEGLLGPWGALLTGAWLTVHDTRVVPGEGMVPAAAPDEDPEAFVRFARALIVLSVLEGLRRDPEEGGLFGGPDTFTALLHTVGPEGLSLPATIRIALDRGLVPVDPGGDPDMDEIHRYWQTERDLSTLAANGLLRRETTPGGQDLRLRGTVEVLVEAYGALEMYQELG